MLDSDIEALAIGTTVKSKTGKLYKLTELIPAVPGAHLAMWWAAPVAGGRRCRLGASDFQPGRWTVVDQEQTDTPPAEPVTPIVIEYVLTSTLDNRHVRHPDHPATTLCGKNVSCSVRSAVAAAKGWHAREGMHDCDTCTRRAAKRGMAEPPPAPGETAPEPSAETEQAPAPATYAEGDAVELLDSDQPGFWIVTDPEASRIARDPSKAGTVLAQRIYTGAGPNGLAIELDLTTIRPAISQPPPFPEGALAVQLTARNGVLTVPLPLTDTSPALIVETVRTLQKRHGLPVDAKLVEFVDGDWWPAPVAEEPAPAVEHVGPREVRAGDVLEMFGLRAEVAAVAWDDCLPAHGCPPGNRWLASLRPVGDRPARDDDGAKPWGMSLCVRYVQENPDQRLRRVSAALKPLAPVTRTEYAVRYTAVRGGGLRTVLESTPGRVYDRAWNEEAVADVRRFQAAGNGLVDAELVSRTVGAAGPWDVAEETGQAPIPAVEGAAPGEESYAKVIHWAFTLADRLDRVDPETVAIVEKIMHGQKRGLNRVSRDVEALKVLAEVEKLHAAGLLAQYARVQGLALPEWAKTV
ncbi:hypothetical protein [Streptosporangium sp. NPDC002524]|uniref:hypothetical protein n=1 Tax=Streptosporangium sp. NPDC002524 TaxID=3154537 RepID=UPI00331C4F6E